MKKKIDFSKIPDKEKVKRLKEEYHEREVILQHERDLRVVQNLQYRYFRFSKNEKEVSISIGYRWIRTLDYRISIEYAIALQSKNDKFSKRKARRIVNERFNDHKFIGFVVGFVADKFSVDQIDLLIAFHYNSGVCDPHSYGMLGIPKYLNKIPIGLIKKS